MSTIHSAFDGPRAKLARARENLSELRERDSRYFEANPFQLTSQPRPDGLIAIKLVLKTPLPYEIVTAAGDSIGNLRAVLDHAVCACALIQGTTNLKNTYFHFAATEPEWEKSLKGRTKAAPEKIREIMRQLRPWRDGNSLLYSLSRMAAVDKHQIVTPMAVVPDIGIRIAPPTAGVHFIRDLQLPGTAWDPTHGEVTLAVCQPNDDIMVNQVHIASFLGFGKVDVVPGQPVLGILYKLANTVHDVIDLFERAMTN